MRKPCLCAPNLIPQIFTVNHDFMLFAMLSKDKEMNLQCPSLSLNLAFLFYPASICVFQGGSDFGFPE